MSERSTHHATFVIERHYDAPPARVFNAWADPAAKERWFGCSEDWECSGFRLDFRVGGREHLSSTPGGGPAHVYDATYQDIVPDQRIVYTYDMRLGDERMSVSLATVELHPSGNGTRLVFTEQAVYLDRFDDPGAREAGTRSLLDSLAAELRK